MNENIKLIPYDSDESPKKGIVLDSTKCRWIKSFDRFKSRQCKKDKGSGPGGNYCPQHALKIEKDSLRRKS